MATLYNRARMSTATTGTGTITLGSAVSDAFFTFAEAGVQNGDVVSYVIEDGNDVEVGIGTYTSSGTTLSRDTVTISKIGGTSGTSKINLSGAATVFITARAEDLITLDANNDASTIRNLTQTGYHDLTEISEPASPASNVIRSYAVDDGNGVSTYQMKDASGNVVKLSHFTQSGTGSVTRTQEAKSQDWVSVLDFIPVSLHAAIRAETSTDEVGTYIQAALDAHSHVWLPHGRYYIDGTTLEPNSGQRLYGPGILYKDTSAGGFTNDFIDIDTKSDIQIIGVQFQEPTGREHAIAIITSTDIVIEGCRLNEPGQTNGTGCDIFVFKNSSRVRISGNQIYGGLGAIATGGDRAGNNDGPVTDIIIAYNYFEGCDDEAIDINWDTQYCTIIGNTINGVGTDNAGNEAIDIGGSVDGTGSKCREIAVIGNTIVVDQTMESGIQVKQYTEGCVIKGNVIRQTATNDQNVNGIILSNTRGVVVEGNMIDGFRNGVAFASTNEDAAVHGNNIKGVQLSAISTDSTSATRVRITNNVCNGEQSATSYGIQVVDATDGVCSNNIVTGFQSEDAILLNNSSQIVCNGNEISDCDTGIFCLADGAVVSSNNIRDCVAQAIRFDCTGYIASDNIMTDNATGGSAYAMTFAAGSDYGTITGNVATDTRGGSATQNGYQFIGACDRLIFNNNIAYPNAGTGVTGTGSLTNSLVGTAGNITS